MTQQTALIGTEWAFDFTGKRMGYFTTANITALNRIWLGLNREEAREHLACMRDRRAQLGLETEFLGPIQPAK